ncbi:hypothetical protein PG993_011307 [Apiospora rasikravindrae]|uniref:Uncharacterized protein n=1 Tax=Apiospora rasikravindrae TaxID=990691 RepID=A0ABR1SE46_9PEZI
MATVTVKEKDGVISDSQSSGLGANDLQRLDVSLEEFSKQSKKANMGRRKRPFFMLVAVLFLFLVSGGGVALAVLSFVKPVEAEGFRLARDLVLVASGMSLLYTIIHVRGAFSNYVNDAPHIPPHFRGEYVHASALIVARLGIPVWIAASVATAILISKSEQPLGIYGNQIPYPLLDLIICVVALISFIALAATINKNPTPFALAGISSSWILTYRDNVNVFVKDDEEEAFVSISRRASMQRAADEKGEKRTTPPIAPSPPPALARPKSTSSSSTSNSSKRMTLTEEALTKATDNERRTARPDNLDIARVRSAEEDAKTELMANSPVRPNYHTAMPPVQRSSIPPVPPLPLKVLKAKAKSQKQQQQQQQRHTLAPPSRGGAGGGGGWRDDWNDLANQSGIQRPRTRSYSSSAEQAGHELQPLQHSQPIAVWTGAVPDSQGQRRALATSYEARQQLPTEPRPIEANAQPLPFLVAGLQRQQHQQPVFVVARQHDPAHAEADRRAENRCPAAARTRARARTGAGRRAASEAAKAEAAEEDVQLLAANYGWERSERR